MIPIKDQLLVSIQIALFIVYCVFSKSIFVLNQTVRYFLAFTIIIALILGVVAILQLNKNLSPYPSPIKGGVLITNGVYKLIRHPIYTSIILVSLSYGLYKGDFIKIGVAIVLWFFFEYKANYEEQLLTKTYHQYANYSKNTGKIFPKVKLKT